MIKEARNKAEFNSSVEDVWEIITNRNNISWRPEIEKVEFINEEEFKETTINGLVTKYIIEEKESCKSYKLKMKNSNIDGIFEAKFKKTGENSCVVELYQKNDIKSVGAMIASFIFVNLQKLQNRYIYDIKKRLGEM
ncbi:hypothetical protein [Miniphocaeibacter massiliensis]|uniref:hypothetical protein n=1 Tax=Miniphocaeibacter massiliensis TaxID=2041841 RepID=UPI000C1C4EB9|nr:hypothetical protein [Miniphocaeibacter massiliensis]